MRYYDETYYPLQSKWFRVDPVDHTDISIRVETPRKKEPNVDDTCEYSHKNLPNKYTNCGVACRSRALQNEAKRLLRFINSDFPTASAMAAWCVYILRSLYGRGNRALRNLLIDETDILKDY